MTRRWQRVALAFAALVAGDCIEGPTGPGSQDPARVRVEVVLPAGTPDAWLPASDTLRVLVRRAGRVEPIVDTAGVTDSLVATVTVPLDQAVERFVATAELVYRGQVLFLAFDAIQLRAALDTTVVLQAVYVGPAGSAAALTVAAADSSLEAGDTTTVVPTALDSLGQSLGRVPVRFLSDRPDLFTVDADGRVTALEGVPDTARVDVVMPTGLTASLPLWLIEVLQPPTGQVVAFISTRDGNREVYAMMADGSGAVRLTASSEDEYFPAWAPDGAAIAFERDVSGSRQIFVVTLASGTVSQLTTTGANTGPRFSPDGARIGFTSTRGGAPEVWVMDADGGNQRRLVDPAGELDAFADWSPDGRQILFVRRPTVGSVNVVVWAADTSGTPARRVIEAGEGLSPNILGARWGPLGGLIAYTQVQGDTGVILYGLDQSGGDVVGRSGAVFDGNPSFALAEDRFVFESDSLGIHAIYQRDAAGTVSRLSPQGVAEHEPDYVPPRPAIYLDRVVISPDSVGLTSDESGQTFTGSGVDVNGRPVAIEARWISPTEGISQLVIGPPVETVALAVGKTYAIASYRGWRTDSAPITITPATGSTAQRLAFRVGSDIYTMRGDGTDTIRLTTPSTGGYDPAYSPDGSRVVWANLASGDGDIWVMNADGSATTPVTSGPAEDRHPSWSPDGQWIVFHSNRVGASPNQWQLWIVRIDGTDLRQLTFPPAANLQDADPAWSPDGSLVLFIRYVLGSGTSSLRAVQVAGGVERALPMPAGSYRFPAWTPDGAAMVYTRVNVGTFIEYLGIGRMPYPSGPETILSTGSTPRGFGSGGHLAPSVASDGLIAVSSGLGVTVMRGDGTGLSGLIPGGVPGNWRLTAAPRYVAEVSIGGDAATPIAVAATRQLISSATDQDGSAITPVAGFRWTSLDPAVATVDSTGLVTGVAPGSARVVAASGLAAPDTATLTVGVTVTPLTRTWVGGDARGPTDWFVAGNWSPAGVPAAGDSVVVPAAADQPVLTAAATVARVRITGGTLTLGGFTLTVNGDFSTEGAAGRLVMQNGADTLVVAGDATFTGAPLTALLTAGVILITGDFTQAYVGSNWESFQGSGSHRTILNGGSAQTVSFTNPGSAGQTSFFHHLEIANTGGGVTFATGAVVNGELRVTTAVAVTGAGTVTVGDSLVTVAGSSVTPAGVRLGGGMAVLGTFSPTLTEFFGSAQVIQGGLGYQNVLVTGQVRLGAPATVSGDLTIVRIVNQPNGDLNLNGQSLIVTGNLRTGQGSDAAGLLTMQDPADQLTVQGGATFAGAADPGRLTAGTLRVAGNFRQQYIGSNWGAFAPSGTHRVILDGTGDQTVQFDSPFGAPGQASFFHGLTVAKPSGAVTLLSTVVVNGQLDAAGQTVLGGGNGFNVAGVAAANNLVLDHVLLTLGAGAIAGFDNVTFQNYAPTATPLAIARPGDAFTFTGLRFLTVPTTGFYLSATDLAPADGNVLTINLVGSQPADGSAQTATAGGAIVNWPGTATGLRTWVGGDPAGATDWHVAGNWNPAAVPGPLDTVVIVSTANQPVLTARAAVERVRILGGNLTLNGHTLAVTDHFSVENGAGTVTMQQPTDSLIVGNDALFQGAPTFGLLTDGVLLVASDFWQLNDGDNWDTFRADDANHRTVLNGTDDQLIVAQGNLSFGHLEIANTGLGVEPSGGLPIEVQGDFRIATPALFNGATAAGLDVEGAVTTVAGSQLVTPALRVGGALSVAGAFDVGFVEFSGADQDIPDLPYQEVQVSETARLAASVAMTSLLISGGSSGSSLTVGGHTLTVGELRTGGGGADPAALVMQHPNDVVVVSGDALFDGDPATDRMTEGVLYIGGDLADGAGSATGFPLRASGNHRTVLNGSGLQRILVGNGSPLFHHLEIANTGLGVDLPLVSGAEVIEFLIGGKLVVSTAVPFTGEDAFLDVRDSLVTVAGSEVTLNGLVLRGGLDVDGALSIQSAELAGTAQDIPAQAILQNVQVSGTARLVASMMFPGFVLVRGDGADLTLNGHRLDVGNFTTGGVGFPTGTLTMTDPADSLVVSGDVVFAGASTVGRLTAGTLVVSGGFFQDEDPSAFQASGTHRTVLAGATQQIVSFASPGTTGPTSRFHHLELRQPAGEVRFQTAAAVTGELLVDGASPQIATGPGPLLTVGGVDVANLTLDGIALAIGAGPITRFDDVTLLNQDPAGVQLEVAHAGAAAAFTFTGVQFLTAPTTGYYISATDVAPGDGNVLTIELAESQPADGSSRTVTSGGAVVTWLGTRPPPFGAMSSGQGYSCGLALAGTPYCWGRNFDGSLGDGTTMERHVPTPVSGNLTLNGIAAGWSHACGLTTTGAAYCWGSNGTGQLGDGTTTNSLVPVAVTGGLSFTTLAAGEQHTCGLTASGSAYCWGGNGFGQLGDETTTDHVTPEIVSGGLTFASVSTGGLHTCAVTTAGEAYCWGSNTFGQLGDGSGSQQEAPVVVSGGLTFSTVSATGTSHSCGVTTGGAAYCWGWNGSGELGNGTTAASGVPVPVSGGLVFASLSAGGGGYTCGLTTAGAAHCWGLNDVGQLGDGTTTPRTTPVPVSGGLTFASIDAGFAHVAAIASGGAGYSWGANPSGELGDGTTTNRSVPTPVAEPLP